jgi:Xaa-Pro aminopeptidase
MTDALLLVGTTDRAPEIRHEVAAAAPDPIIWLERDGAATVWASSLDIEPLRAGRAIDDLRDSDQLGYEELRRSNGYEQVFAEMARRALAAEGIGRVVVPWEFAVGIGDHLRGGGIDVVADADVFAARRRDKRAWELDGMRAAGAAAQAAFLEAARLLRERVDGLTCEEVREHMTAALLAHGAESEEILIHSGTAVVGGHDLGLGPIVRDAPVQIDCFPRHRASGLYIDMARTWVPGTPSDEARRCHADILAARDAAFAAARPGVEDLYDRAARVLHERGHPTRYAPAGGERPPRPESGFMFSLGHGVGLEVHEAPSLGVRADPLAAGDTIAIEPHLAYPGLGELMVEDTVQVTDGGAEHLFEPLPYGLDVPGA